MLGSDNKAKKFLVVRHIHYDWNLYDDEIITDCDTVEEAQDIINKLVLTREGLSQTLHIFEKRR